MRPVDERSLRVILRYTAFWAALIAGLFYFGQPAAQAASVLAALWGLRSPFHAVQALTVLWFAGSFNDGVAFEPGTAMVGGDVVSSTLSGIRLAAIGLIFARMVAERLLRHNPPSDRLCLRIALFTIVAAALAVLTSNLLDVSLFKLLLFAMGALSTTMAVSFAIEDRREDTFYWFWGSCAALVILSAPLLALPLGYVRNQAGFQGWLNQPQAFGLFLAPTVVLFAGLALFERVWTRPNLALALLAAVELFATLSRNGLLAAMLGAIVGIAINLRRDPRKWLPLASFMAIGLVAALLMPSTQAYLGGLVRKDSADAIAAPVDIGESFTATRGLLIEEGLRNFASSPLAGIGFGVAADPTAINVRRDPYFGLPVSASIEKGVVWIAALEETGVIGALFIVALLVELFAGALRQNITTGLAVTTAALMTNNGEATLFSFNGHGLFLWLMIAFAYGTGRRAT